MTKAIDDNAARRLLVRCSQGDEKALVELHSLLAQRIHAFAFHRLQNAHEASSVVVDTLYEIWKSASKFRGDSQVSTWALGIARFVILAAMRARGPTMEDVDLFGDVLESGSHNGEVELERWQEAELVRACLKTLSAAHRECMQLVYYDGMGLAQVAELQGVPENTVKTRLFSARKLMRTCVESGNKSQA